MAHSPVSTWSWLVVALAALAWGLVTILGGRQRPVIGAVWVVLGLVNTWGAWRRLVLSRGGHPRA
jgi:hypothetical protein